MSTTIIPLPGILALNKESHAPLMFDRFGQMEWTGTSRERFESDKTIADVVRRADQLRLSGRQVTLLGSSLGGMQMAFVVQALRKKLPQNNFEWLKVILVDSPNGSRTCKGLEWVPSGGLLAWLAMSILRVFGFFIMWIGRMGPGLPKDDEISQPSPAVMAKLGGRSDMTTEEWKQHVKATAKQGLKGHKVSVWAHQVRWMAKVGADGSLQEAAQALRGIDVTYLMCTDGNGTVVQPDAANWWSEYSGAEVIEVASPHCGYLQKQVEFDRVFVDLLGD